MRNWRNGVLAALLLGSLAAGCAFWQDAEPAMPSERPAVSSPASTPAAGYSDAMPAKAERKPAVTLRARRARKSAAAPAVAAAPAEETMVAEASAPELPVEETPLAEAVALAPVAATPTPVAEAAAEEPPIRRPSLMLPVAVVLGFGLLGLWFSSRQLDS